MDLADLAPLYATDGPFVTIWLDAPSNTESSAQEYDLKWKNILRELESKGVDAQTREAIEAHRGEHMLGDSRVVVATPGDHSVKLAMSLPDRPPVELVDVAPLPKLVPLVSHLATKLPYVLVLADRSGAEVEAYSADSGTPQTTTVDGTAPDIRKVRQGGWAHLRYQHRAEGGWEANADQVVREVERAAEAVGARLVVLAAEERMRPILRDKLPQRLQEVLVEVDGQRADDGAGDLVRERARQAAEERGEKDLIALLEKYAQERGQRDKACEGVADTVEALRMAQVDVLLLTDEAPLDEPLWYGPEPAVLGTSADELAGLGVAAPMSGPAVDVLLRAALGTGARVRRVPAGTDFSPAGGVGALLRYSTGTAGAQDAALDGDRVADGSGGRADAGGGVGGA